MQTGAPTFGTPEPAKVLLGCAKLARRLSVPFRSGGSLTAAKTADAQAAYESANTIMPTVMGGVNFVLHAGGWMEGGLVADYAKLILDADQLTMMQDVVNGIDVSENGVGVEKSLLGVFAEIHWYHLITHTLHMAMPAFLVALIHCTAMGFM